MKNQLSLFSFFIVILYIFALPFSPAITVDAKKPSYDTAVYPNFSTAKEFKTVNTVVTNGFVTVTSGIDNAYYLLDSANRTGFLYTEIKTSPFQTNRAGRIPLNLSLVIDRSGSMAGEKMDSAKKAAKGIIDKLQPQDFVSIVMYDEYIDVLQPSVRAVYKDSIKAKIDKIKPRGSTNLWGGSEKGYEQVKAAYKPAFVNRVLLISDGRANAGIVHAFRIREKVQEMKDVEGISISTFGVGLDYNETLMTDMAESGAGNYYYIDKPGKMEAAFDRELASLMNTVAQAAELRITIPRGITLQNVYPYKYALEKNVIVIKYRDLFSDETKAFILQYKLDDGWSKEATFTTRLSYLDATDNQPKTIIAEHVLSPTKNLEIYLTHFNRTVAEQAVLFAANESMEKAMLEADKRKFDKAMQMMNEALSILRSNRSTSTELKKMDSVGSRYAVTLAEAKALSADSLSRLQKSSRADSYRIRNKKN